MKLNRFAWYAWGVLGYNILVILWGAVVRATGSGAGCGSHWPLCNGEVVPLAEQTETLIEFTHRVTSGLALIMVVILLIWAMRAYAKDHPVRLGAKLSMAFMIIEALIGAALVIFELVAYNTSLTRAVMGGLHLANTYILLAALTLTAWWASGGQPVRWRGRGWLRIALWASFVGILLIGATGAVAALGNTLFPSASLAEGIRQDFSPTAHLLIRLRLSHPILAIVLGATIILIMNIFNGQQGTPVTARLTKIFVGLYVIQLVGGALNIVLLAPVWMQLFHLLMSDLILIFFVLFVAAAFAEDVPARKGSLLRPTAQPGERVYAE